MPDPHDVELDIDGPAAPPRDNGELVFGAPWQRRVFGLTISMSRSSVFEWESFRQRLIARIAEDDARPYWDSWMAAFEDVLAATGTLTPTEVDARQAAYTSRPLGHDHGGAGSVPENR